MQLAAVLTALAADAWVAGHHFATSVLPTDASVPPAPVAWDEWAVGWGETASEVESPAELLGLLAGQAQLAVNLCTSKTVMAAAVPGSAVDLDAYASNVAGTQVALNAEDAAQAVYKSAGVRWYWLDDGEECDDCAAMAAGGPYGPNDPHPPLHPNCQCESAVTNG